LSYRWRTASTTKLKHWLVFTGTRNEGKKCTSITLFSSCFACKLTLQLLKSVCSCSRTLTFDLTKYKEAWNPLRLESSYLLICNSNCPGWSCILVCAYKRSVARSYCTNVMRLQFLV
jgi:hypothetical protein